MIPYFFGLFSLSDAARPEDIMSLFKTFMISLVFYVLITLTTQVILCLIKYLALHKIFSQYSAGQKPVFYMIIAMFVPYAEAVLLFRHRNRQMLEPIFEINTAEPAALAD